MKFNELGRSMVEMLGVLAIIGVLSVGAIAGYSKAMMKYKLNKQAEQLSAVINAGLRYAKHWNFKNVQYVNTIPYLIKLNEIPQEMIKNNSTSVIYDVFNNSMNTSYTINEMGEIYTQLFIQLDTSKNDQYSLSICRNIVNVAKEFHQSLRSMSIISGSSGDGYDANNVYGDSYCNTSNKCLKDITVTDIDNWCRYNAGKTSTPHIKLIWDE